MRTLLAALTALMLFATPVVAGDGDKTDCITTTGVACETRARAQDKFDIAINLFELGNVEITFFKSELLAITETITHAQRIKAKVDGKPFYVRLQQSAKRWGDIADAYNTKQEFGHYKRQKKSNP